MLTTKKPRGRPRKPLALKETYGAWTVIGPTETIRGKSKTSCRCKCGIVKVVCNTYLRKTKYPSCFNCAHPRRGQGQSSSENKMTEKEKRAVELYSQLGNMSTVSFKLGVTRQRVEQLLRHARIRFDYPKETR